LKEKKGYYEGSFAQHRIGVEVALTTLRVQKEKGRKSANLKLNIGVTDIELFIHQLIYFFQNLTTPAEGNVIHNDMSCHSVHMRSNYPDVNIVYCFHPGNSSFNDFCHFINIYILWRCLQEDIGGFCQEPYRSYQDQATDEYADERVNDEIAGVVNNQAPENYRTRKSRITYKMNESAPHIDVSPTHT